MHLEQFSARDRWDERLADLADMAEPERWAHRTLPNDQPFEVLRHYVDVTFEQCSEQGKVLESDGWACFNTGLLGITHEEIFGLFAARKPDSDPSAPRWVFASWTAEGSPKLRPFASLPTMASYWDAPRQVTFNPTFDITVRARHIVVDNRERFPAALGGTVGEDGVPASPKGAAPGWGRVGGDLSVALRNSLDGALARSLRLSRRNHRLAVPQWHQRAVQFVLPLYLRDWSRADLALVLQPEPAARRYLAKTVLHLDWAYKYARVLSRVDSLWLGDPPWGYVDLS